MSPGSRKALLIDIDGTLADTDALHLEAFNQVLGPRGQVFDHARFTRELQGFSNASIGARFLAGEPPARQAAMVAAGAAMTAKTFDDPELVKLVGATMNW
jgi:beta-phosphoglucomutase-like phosphatase (HAD superfamily)